MKYLLSLLLLLTGIANAGQEPYEDERVYLYIFMNGQSNIIKYYREEMPDMDFCLERVQKVRLGKHSRATVFCGGVLEGDVSDLKWKANKYR